LPKTVVNFAYWFICLFIYIQSVWHHLTKQYLYVEVVYCGGGLNFF
jgi:hypothetical protein